VGNAVDQGKERLRHFGKTVSDDTDVTFHGKVFHSHKAAIGKA